MILVLFLDFARLRQNPAQDDGAIRSEVGVVLPPPPTGLMTTAVPPAARNWQTTLLPQGAPSMVSAVDNQSDVRMRFYMMDI